MELRKIITLFLVVFAAVVAGIFIGIPLMWNYSDYLPFF